MGCSRQSEPRVLEAVVPLEYTVRRAKRRVHGTLLVDGINEVGGLHNINLRVLVEIFFLWTFM